MSNTFRTIIVVVALAATAGVALGVPAVEALKDGPPPQCAPAESRYRHSPDGDRALALRRAGREIGELVEDLGRRRRALDAMPTEIAAIEALAVRIADWPGTDNDPLLDGMVAQQFEAILELVGGDTDLARRTLIHVSGGLGVAEAVERGQQEVFAARLEDVMTALGPSRAAQE